MAGDSEELAKIVERLRYARSSWERVQLLYRSWKLVKNLPRDQRERLALQLGIEHADEIVEMLAAQKKGGPPPDELLLAVHHLEKNADPEKLRVFLHQVQDPRQRRAALRGAAEAALEAAAGDDVHPSAQQQAAAPWAPLGPGPGTHPLPPPTAVTAQQPAWQQAAAQQAAQQQAVQQAQAQQAAAQQLAAQQAAARAALDEAERRAREEAERAVREAEAARRAEIAAIEAEAARAREAERAARQRAAEAAQARHDDVHHDAHDEHHDEAGHEGALLGALSAARGPMARLGALRAPHDPLSLDEVRAALDHFGAPWQRRRALCALLQAGSPAAVADALAIVDEQDPIARRFAITALERRQGLSPADEATVRAHARRVRRLRLRRARPAPSPPERSRRPPRRSPEDRPRSATPS